MRTMYFFKPYLKWSLFVGISTFVLLAVSCKKDDDAPPLQPTFNVVEGGRLVIKSDVIGSTATKANTLIVAGEKEVRPDSVSAGYLDVLVRSDLGLKTGRQALSLKINNVTHDLEKDLLIKGFGEWTQLEGVEWLGLVRMADTKKAFAGIKTELQPVAGGNGAAVVGGIVGLLNEWEKQLKYDVDVYKLVYNVAKDNLMTKASALLCVPTASRSYSVLAVNHPTVASNDEAPTPRIKKDVIDVDGATIANPTAAIKKQVETMTLFGVTLSEAQRAGLAGRLLFDLASVYIAQAGHIVVASDYIGYGESLAKIHPYYVADLAGHDVRTAVEAGYLFTSNSGRDAQNLYLSGYSEGGYVSVAAHRVLEKNPVNGLTVAQTFAGAPGLDLVAVEDTILNEREVYPQTYFFPLLMLAYQEYYDNVPGLGEFFEAEKVAVINQLLDDKKSHNGDVITASLGTNIAALLHDEYHKMGTLAKYKAFKDALKANSFREGTPLVKEWTPKAKIHMYHSEGDTYLPYRNSVEAAKAIGGQARLLPLVNPGNAMPDHPDGAFTYMFVLLSELTAARAQ